MKLKRITFKKGIDIIHIPFILNNLSDWKKQVEDEITKLKKEYTWRKSAWIGFEITESQAELKLYRNKITI